VDVRLAKGLGLRLRVHLVVAMTAEKLDRSLLVDGASVTAIATDRQPSAR
jgi:hypothetical protein